ncbi:MAG: hypothetical protein A4E67_01356 [Syntrophaceae bacterium PtaB.Bin038]|nr:MAG: hypothetical protein A4E67_01356 [Syntrophaceae bacterium PtaB.Bin038]
MTPRKIVTMLIKAFWAVSLRRPTTPDSRNKFPSISIPISGAASGSISTHTIVTAIGKMIRSVFDTGRSCSITTVRIFFVVSSFMIGGWMIGTSAMYE